MFIFIHLFFFQLIYLPYFRVSQMSWDSQFLCFQLLDVCAPLLAQRRRERDCLDPWALFGLYLQGVLLMCHFFAAVLLVPDILSL